MLFQMLRCQYVLISKPLLRTFLLTSNNNAALHFYLGLGNASETIKTYSPTFYDLSIFISYLIISNTISFPPSLNLMYLFLISSLQVSSYKLFSHYLIPYGTSIFFPFYYTPETWVAPPWPRCTYPTYYSSPRPLTLRSRRPGEAYKAYSYESKIPARKWSINLLYSPEEPSIF